MRRDRLASRFAGSILFTPPSPGLRGRQLLYRAPRGLEAAPLPQDIDSAALAAYMALSEKERQAFQTEWRLFLQSLN